MSAPWVPGARALPRISVVIPTVGRASLRDAVESALAQRGVDVEVIVVADLPAAIYEGAAAPAAGVRLLSTGGGRGAGYARQLGTRLGTRPWVAYLDDDDVWAPDKLRLQHAVAAASRASGASSLVSCRVMSCAGGRRAVAPTSCYRAGPVPDYLFHRRRLASGRALVHTSTLLLSRRLALRVGWDPDLRRHQDWDFVVRCAREPGVAVIQLDAVLVEVQVSVAGSISSSADWRASLGWYDRASADWSTRARSDFLVGQVLRYSLQARSREGVLAVARRVVRLRPPTLGAIALGIAGAAPRSLFVRVMHWRRAG